jgi:hypothetical protein
MGVANDRVLALLQQQLIPNDHVYVHVGSSRHIVAANAVCDGAQGGLERSAAPTHCTGIQQRQAIQRPPSAPTLWLSGCVGAAPPL